MEDNKAAMEQAAKLLEQHKYREALAAFTKIYALCTDKNECEDILEKIDEEIYPHIMEELQANYEKNLETLKKYPYFQGALREYDDLPFLLFPASEEYLKSIFIDTAKKRTALRESMTPLPTVRCGIFSRIQINLFWWKTRTISTTSTFLTTMSVPARTMPQTTTSICFMTHLNPWSV